MILLNGTLNEIADKASKNEWSWGLPLVLLVALVFFIAVWDLLVYADVLNTPKKVIVMVNTIALICISLLAVINLINLFSLFA